MAKNSGKTPSKRIGDLIREGRAIIEAVREIPGGFKTSFVSGERYREDISNTPGCCEIQKILNRLDQLLF